MGKAVCIRDVVRAMELPSGKVPNKCEYLCFIAGLLCERIQIGLVAGVGASSKGDLGIAANPVL